MQAIILAAGMGKRLKDLTLNNTKCMVKVNGITIIERLLNQLDGLKLKKIVIVIGYKGDILRDFLDTLHLKTPIELVDNPLYERTNNIYSLWLAKERLTEDDSILLESDLIFEDGILEDLLADERPTLALVDKYESWMDGTCVVIDDEDRIEAFVPKSKFRFEDIDRYYKTVNIYKFSKDFLKKQYLPFLDAYIEALGGNEYYEQVLRVITMLDNPSIKAKRLNGKLWYEIDDIQDLDIAESMFNNDDEEKLRRLQARYGGYWRYPKMIDFCYLVNPYFPPRRLVDEIKANFNTLITEYPSGMDINCILASKNFGVSADNIVVGNGAAELIKSLTGIISGKVGVIRPTFEEYPNRLKDAELVEMDVTPYDFKYDEDSIMSFFADKNLSWLVLINPDNPSGNYVTRAGLIKLINWCKVNDIKLIVDESFSDFSDERGNTLIDVEILRMYEGLTVIKSISKSYGVPGIRLGIAVSADENLIRFIKKDVSIWNINSFCEFYMQIEEKYKEEYMDALELLREARKKLSENLSAIEGINVLPSHANYLMLEIVDGKSSKQVTKELLLKHNILIKDLTEKIGSGGKQYVRVAIRNIEDNNKLVDALKSVMKDEAQGICVEGVRL